VYSIALVAVTIAGALIGDLDEGLLWMSEPGTYKEFVDNVPIAERTWSVPGKIAVLAVFSATGFFALSCCSALTKNFGALTMSVTSTTRKATTLFLSFLLFDNVFTVGHFIGIGVFIPSLLVMAMSRREADNNRRNQIKRKFSGVELNNTKANRQASAKGHGKEKDSLTLRHGAAAAP
jgi:UAA transporter family